MSNQSLWDFRQYILTKDRKVERCHDPDKFAAWLAITPLEIAETDSFNVRIVTRFNPIQCSTSAKVADTFFETCVGYGDGGEPIVADTYEQAIVNHRQECFDEWLKLHGNTGRTANAMQAVVDSWVGGDLAAAVRELNNILTESEFSRCYDSTP